MRHIPGRLSETSPLGGRSPAEPDEGRSHQIQRIGRGPEVVVGLGHRIDRVFSFDVGELGHQLTYAVEGRGAGWDLV